MADKENSEVSTGKEVAFYAATLAAWTSSRMELDRSKLTLSVAGVGLLVTLLTAIGVETRTDLMLFVFAIALFLITIACVLIIFQRNTKYVKELAKGSTKSDRVLRKLDFFSSISFFIAVIFSIMIGLSQGLASVGTKQEICMSENKEKAVQSDTLKKSLEGLGDLKPTSDDVNSNSDSDKQSTESDQGKSDSKDK